MFDASAIGSLILRAACARMPHRGLFNGGGLWASLIRIWNLVGFLFEQGSRCHQRPALRRSHCARWARGREDDASMAAS